MTPRALIPIGVLPRETSVVLPTVSECSAVKGHTGIHVSPLIGAGEHRRACAFTFRRRFRAPDLLRDFTPRNSLETFHNSLASVPVERPDPLSRFVYFYADPRRLSLLPRKRKLARLSSLTRHLATPDLLFLFPSFRKLRRNFCSDSRN